MTTQSKALKNYKAVCKRRQENLLDPNWGGSAEARCFPRWEPGMTTREYLRRYQNLCNTLAVGYTYADRAAAMLDPFEPEVVEELEL